MISQIVYVLVANEKNLYLEELWVSVYSLRMFHPNVNVKVLVDEDTRVYMQQFPELCKLVSEIIVVPTPEGYNAKQRSRQIKTTIRNVIDGDYLFIDTDTVICKSLDCLTSNISSLNRIHAVPDGHVMLDEHLFGKGVVNSIKHIFDVDYSDAEYWFNSGVMYVPDSLQTREFYKCWNKNWKYSCFDKGNSQDQPALGATDKDFGYVIEELPGIYNAQVAMSLKYFADAAILHWWHMDFIENQDYSPYFSLELYRRVKIEGGITPDIVEQIINCKSSFATTTMPVGKEHILFLFSPVGKIFNRVYRDGGVASWLMQKIAGWLELLHKYTKKR